MSSNESEKLVRDFMVDHDPQFLADDAVLYDFTLPEPLRGKEAVSRMLEMLYRTAFPGAKADLKRVISSGSTVATEFTFIGVNDGNLLGNPATHREVNIPMCTIYDVSNGKVKEIHLYYDSALLTRQLGMGAATSAH